MPPSLSAQSISASTCLNLCTYVSFFIHLYVKKNRCISVKWNDWSFSRLPNLLSLKCILFSIETHTKNSPGSKSGYSLITIQDTDTSPSPSCCVPLSTALCLTQRSRHEAPVSRQNSMCSESHSSLGQNYPSGWQSVRPQTYYIIWGFLIPWKLLEYALALRWKEGLTSPSLLKVDSFWTIAWWLDLLPVLVGFLLL